MTLSTKLYNARVPSSVFPLPYSASSSFCFNNQSFGATPAQDINLYPNRDDGIPLLLFPCATVVDTGTPAGITQDTLMRAMGDGTAYAAFPALPVQTTSVADMTRVLIANQKAKQYAASTIAALTFVAVAGETAPSGAPVITKASFIIHGNYTAIYAGPVASALVGDALVKTINPQASVTARLHPLPLSYSQNVRQSNYNVNLAVTFILLAMPYVPAAFGTFIVRERQVSWKG